MNSMVLRVVAIVVCLGAVAAAVPLGSRIGAAMRGGEGAADGPYRAVVSIPPLKSLVECYSGGRSREISVEVLVPPGASEHGYEIPPSKLATLARADLVVLVGLGMEPQVEKFLKSNPREGRRVIRFADVVGIDAGHEHHDHEHGEECDHGTVDPHLWLDPVMVRKLVEAIGEVMTEEWNARGLLSTPGVLEGWETHCLANALRIENRHEIFKHALARVPRRTIVVGHDAWGHLARRYGLETVAIKGLTASEPTPAAIQSAIETIKAKGVTTVFVEPQLNQAAARRIAEATGAKVAVLDPLGDGDWHEMMDKNLEALVAALSDE